MINLILTTVKQMKELYFYHKFLLLKNAKSNLFLLQRIYIRDLIVYRIT